MQKNHYVGICCWDYDYLHSLIKQSTIQAQIVIRTHVLLECASGISIWQEYSPNI